MLHVTRVFTKHDVQALTTDSVDGVTGEPTHTVGRDILGIVGATGSIGDTLCCAFSSRQTVFINGSVTTHSKTTGVAFGKRIVIAHLDNRATRPLALVSSQNDTHAGQLGKFIVVEGLVENVGQQHALKTIAADTEAVKHMVIVGNERGETKARVERHRGHDTVGSPGTTHNIFIDLCLVNTLAGVN